MSGSPEECAICLKQIQLERPYMTFKVKADGFGFVRTICVDCVSLIKRLCP
jgi:hypothetical protein